MKDIYTIDSGYKNEWKNAIVKYREGNSASSNDYHVHEFYEINLILSGNVKILLKDHSEQTNENRIVLTRPRTPHYITCQSDSLYKRLYLRFTREFVADRIPEWQNLDTVFGRQGQILMVNDKDVKETELIINEIGKETSPLRQRLMIYFLLSKLSELSKVTVSPSANIPSYILEAITYLETNYGEKFTASDLASKLYIGRTTLMTEFKKHTGYTLGEYLTNCRLKNAIRFLEQGNTVEETARLCGFSDSCSLIHNFKNRFGTTPKQYIKKM